MLCFGTFFVYIKNSKCIVYRPVDKVACFRFDLDRRSVFFHLLTMGQPVDSVLSAMLGKSATGATPYFALFGMLTAAYLGLKFTKSVFSGLFTFVLSKGINLRKFGEWAGMKSSVK